MAIGQYTVIVFQQLLWCTAHCSFHHVFFVSSVCFLRRLRFENDRCNQANIRSIPEATVCSMRVAAGGRLRRPRFVM